MVKINSATKFYLSNNNETIRGIDKITLDLPNNGLIQLNGDSGSGKSTLLNVISGLIELDYGTIEINDFNYTNKTLEEIKNFRLSNISFLKQENDLIENFSVFYNIFLSSRLLYDTNSISKSKTLEVIEKLDISNLKNKKVKDLSGGEIKKVQLAKILSQNSNIILLDELFSELDTEFIKKIKSFIIELSKTKLVIIVDHLMIFNDNEININIKLENGKLISQEKKNDLSALITQSNTHKKLSILGLSNFFVYDILNRKTEYLKRTLIYFILFIVVFLSILFLLKVDYKIIDDNDSKIVYIQKDDNTSFTKNDYNKIKNINLSNYSVSPFSGFSFTSSYKTTNDLTNPKLARVLLASNVLNDELLHGNIPSNKNEIVVYDGMAIVGETIKLMLNTKEYDLKVSGITNKKIGHTQNSYILINDELLIDENFNLRMDLFLKNYIESNFRTKSYHQKGYISKINVDKHLTKNTLYVSNSDSIKIDDYYFITLDENEKEVNLKIDEIIQTNDKNLIGNFYISNKQSELLFNNYDYSKELKLISKNRLYINDFVKEIDTNKYTIIDPFYIKENSSLLNSSVTRIFLLLTFIVITILILLTYKYVKKDEHRKDSQILKSFSIMGISNKNLLFYKVLQYLFVASLSYILLLLTIIILKFGLSLPYEIGRSITFSMSFYILILFLLLPVYSYIKRRKEQ